MQVAAAGGGHEGTRGRDKAAANVDLQNVSTHLAKCALPGLFRHALGTILAMVTKLLGSHSRKSVKPMPRTRLGARLEGCANQSGVQEQRLIRQDQARFEDTQVRIRSAGICIIHACLCTLFLLQTSVKLPKAASLNHDEKARKAAYILLGCLKSGAFSP